MLFSVLRNYWMVPKVEWLCHHFKNFLRKITLLPSPIFRWITSSFNKKFNCTDPICRCGLDIESNKHYLLQCPLFTGPRCPMLKSIMDVLTENVVHSDKHLCQFLLYGKNNLTHLENTNILNATIKYLKNSKRFKTLEEYLDANPDIQAPSSQSPPS